MPVLPLEAGAVQPADVLSRPTPMLSFGILPRSAALSRMIAEVSAGPR
jgi:hypothetical protein